MKRSWGLTLSILCLFCALSACSVFAGEFRVVGQGKNGFYRQIISQSGTCVTLECHNKIVEGGSVEGDPFFTIKGTFQNNLAVDLSVESRDVVVDVNAIQAVARVDYLVTGKIGSQRVAFTIVDDHPIIEVHSGLNVQAGFRKRLKEIDFTFESVSEYKDMYGMKIETKRYHIFNGPAGSSFRVENFSKDSFTVSETGSIRLQSLLVILRPFLLR